MGNQIKFSSQKKEEPFSVSEDDYRALEIENIQLKNTNRKLISKLDKQKELIKKLALELKTIKDNQENTDVSEVNELQKNYNQLKNKQEQLENTYEALKKELKKSAEEIARLKKTSAKESGQDVTENATDSTKAHGDAKTSEISTPTSHWDRLKNRLPPDIKNLRDSKKESE